MSDGITIRVGDRQTAISELGGRFAFDGTSLAFDELTLRSPEAQVRLDGTVNLLAAEPRADVRYAGRADLGRLAPWLAVDPVPRGVIAFSGRLDGTFASPRGTFDVRSDRIGWSGFQDMSFEARGTASNSAATVESFRVALAEGDVTGEARLPFGQNEPGHVRARWRDLDVGAIAGAVAADLGVRLASVADGTVTLDWTGYDILSARGSISNHLAGVASRRGALVVEGRTDVNVDRGTWRLSFDQRIGDAIALSGTVGGRLDAADLAASTVQGPVSLQVAQLHQALQHLAAAGLASDTEAMQPLRAGIDLTATVGGTLRSPGVTGTLEARDLRYGEIGPAVARASFNANRRRVTLDAVRVDDGPNTLSGRIALGIDGKTLAGDLTADVPDLARLAAIVPADWRPDGSARVEAHISGALDNPAIVATLLSDDVRVAGQTVQRLRASARLDDHLVALDRLELDQDEGRLVATGRYAIPDGRFVFDATGSDLTIDPIVRRASAGVAPTPDVAAAAPIPIDARFDFHVSGDGTVASPRAQGFVEFSRLAWDRYQLGNARIDALVEQRCGPCHGRRAAPAGDARRDRETGRAARVHGEGLVRERDAAAAHRADTPGRRDRP